MVFRFPSVTDKVGIKWHSKCKSEWVCSSVWEDTPVRPKISCWESASSNWKITKSHETMRLNCTSRRIVDTWNTLHWRKNCKCFKICTAIVPLIIETSVPSVVAERQGSLINPYNCCPEPWNCLTGSNSSHYSYDSWAGLVIVEKNKIIYVLNTSRHAPGCDEGNDSKARGTWNDERSVYWE